MAVRRPAKTATLWVLLLGVGLLSVLPFVWVIAGSLKGESAIGEGAVWPWQSYKVHRAGEPGTTPKPVEEHVTLDNYRQVASGVSELPTYYVNTIYLSAAGTFLSLLVGTLAAYGFARFRFRGARLQIGRASCRERV